MRSIAVLTSGGDAPGMNSAIRAVVRTGVTAGLKIYGVENGFLGLVQGKLAPMGNRDVSNIIQRGGTVLGSARLPEFRTVGVQNQAVEVLKKFGIDGLVVIGGNGSQTGAHALSKLGVRVVGVASTIDNDLFGSDITIGVDTALNIALEAVDRLKVTASSHHRAFLIEVMGRHCGYLALMTALAGGAEAVVIPEEKMDLDALASRLNDAYDKGKKHAIVVVAEGAQLNAEKLGEFFTKKALEAGRKGYELRVTLLGHVQRGGCPSAADRILGARLGAAAVAHLKKNEHGLLMGIHGNQVGATPLDTVVNSEKTIDLGLLELARTLD